MFDKELEKLLKQSVVDALKDKGVSKQQNVNEESNKQKKLIQKLN